MPIFRPGMGGVSISPRSNSPRGGSISFTEETVAAFSAFYNARSDHHKYCKDVAWLKTKKAWATLQKSQNDLDFLQSIPVHATTEEVSESPVGSMLAATCEQIGTLTLATTLVVGRNEEEAAVRAPEVFGRLCNDTWLNDSIVYMTLRAMSAMDDDVTIFDPLRPGAASDKTPPLPTKTLKSQRVIVFPINIRGKHWSGIYVVLDWEKKHNAFVYEPQCKPDLWGDAVEAAWVQWAKPALDAWWTRDALNACQTMDLTDSTVSTLGIGDIHREYVQLPRQTDGSNCGVYVIAAAYWYLRDEYGTQDMPTISKMRLKLMRLRIMHLIVTTTTRRVDEVQKSQSDADLARLDAFAKTADAASGPSRRCAKKR